MNNPFANFDLEESLAGLPDALRQPMFLAVAASTVVHGLAFLVLPVVTNSAESKKLPDRIVGVVELTPEQQAKLPPSMMVSQFPASPVPLLPTTLGGKLPLTGLFPGMPNTDITTPATKNPINSLMDSIERDTKIASGNNSYYMPPIQTYAYTPPTKTETPTKTEAEKKADADAEKKKLDLAVQQEIEKREADKLKAEKDKKDTPPGTGTTVDPNQQPTTPGSTPNPPNGKAPGANDLKLSPAEQAQQQAVLAEQQKQFKTARTFTIAGTSTEDYRGKVNGDFFPKVIKTTGKTISELYAVYPNKVSQAFPENAVPADWQLDFTGVPKDQKYVTVIEAYVKADGTFAFEPEVTRPSGFGLLDEQALKQLAEYLKTKKPDLGKDQFVEFTFPFVQNAPA